MILLSCGNWQKKEETGRVIFSCLADFAASRPSRYSGVLISNAENSHPPTVTVTGPLLVHDRDAAPLTPSLLLVTDPDTPSQRLTFHLLTLPDMGQVLVTQAGGCIQS
jgi:hypothetical protein